MWMEHFKELLNCVKKEANSSSPLQLEANPRLTVSPDEIEH